MERIKKVSDEEEKCVRTVKMRKEDGRMEIWMGCFILLYINAVTFTLQCCKFVVIQIKSFACKLEGGCWNELRAENWRVVMSLNELEYRRKLSS